MGFFSNLGGSISRIGNSAISGVSRIGQKLGSVASDVAGGLHKALPVVADIGNKIADVAEYARPIASMIHPALGGVVGAIGAGARLGAKFAGKANQAVTTAEGIGQGLASGDKDAVSAGVNNLKNQYAGVNKFQPSMSELAGAKTKLIRR